MIFQVNNFLLAWANFSVELVERHFLLNEAVLKHVNSKAKLKVKISREQNLAVYLKKYDESVHPKRETLPTEQRVYRIKVLKTFMRAGVPLSKLEYFRDILEENALRLTERSHMLDFVPFLLEEEKSYIKEEINGKHLFIIFDGTTRLGEVVAIIVRYVHEWDIQ